MDITQNRPPARCLDLTRLVSRVDRGPMTGIDRVELAYLEKLLSIEDPLFTLVNMGRMHFLMDRKGSNTLHRKLTGLDSWGKANWKSQVFRKRSASWRRAFSDIEKLSIGTAITNTLARLVARILPNGAVYLNVGHSNLVPNTFDAISSAMDAKIAVLIHDSIPLDFPQFQQPGAAEKFEEKLRLVGQKADLVIFNSLATKKTTELYFRKWGMFPQSLVAHLGVDVEQPTPQDIPADLNLTQPYFVTVGTIEPRKNHALLLDIWRKFAAENDPPTLVIIGSRGWNNRSVFDRLDVSPSGILELSGLTDGAVSALVQGSAGLMFPSFAEGFGLPPAQAARLGVPVICGNLDVYNEVLADYPVYAAPGDMYQWETIIRKLADSVKTRQATGGVDNAAITLPSWNDHFNLVLELM